MGRLPLVTLAALLACDEPDAHKAPAGRSEAVTATAKSAAPRASSAEPRKARALCSEKPSAKLPDGKLETAAAKGAAAPPATIPFGAGKWIWLNLWAAWCVPCKEEMPLLLSWQSELRRRGVLLDLAFVSLDDDERELGRFLDAQPENGLRASYWLPEKGRDAWLGALGLATPPRLPVQALVSPKGDVACVIDGAVEAGDFARIAAFVGG